MSLRALIVVILLIPIGAAAQGTLAEAYREYQAGNMDKAREQVDQVIGTPEHNEDPEAWLLRGFIYKDLYKDNSSASDADEMRANAIESLQRAIALDQEGSYRDNAVKAYDFLARSYYNDAARALGGMQPDRAVELFERYKRAVVDIDPKTDLRAREIEFNNALGTVYTKSFGMDRTRIDQFDKAVAAFRDVLAKDPENYGANYNLATLYYNRGVFQIRTITAEHDIPSIQQIQEVSREFFNDALPYMLKAHDMNPNRRETLLGLEGIYYSLQDQESSDKYRKLFEELPPQEQDR